MSAQENVNAVKAHAMKNYNAGGWDVVVECWEDDQILEYIIEANATTAEESIKAFEGIVSIWADQQADAINSAF